MKAILDSEWTEDILAGFAAYYLTALLTLVAVLFVRGISANLGSRTSRSHIRLFLFRLHALFEHS